jgi:5-(aminomethyl)-3-furanmethanol phosphate kinase
MITVFKLGGSLLKTELLITCLEQIQSYPGIKLIVPGGGVFADLVRSQQKQHRFDDSIAHQMALLAMHQTALIIQSLYRGKSEGIHSLSQPMCKSHVYIWYPDIHELNHLEVPNTWSVTSDSLSAIVCRQIQADGLIIFKSVIIDSESSFSELTDKGILDEAFVYFTQALKCPIHVIHPKQLSKP